MATKPTKRTDWATDGGGALITATDSSRWTLGWQTLPDNLSTQPGEKPNLNQQNYWQNAVHDWKEYFEDLTDEMRSGGYNGPQATAHTLVAISPEDVYIDSPVGAVDQTLPSTDVLAGKRFTVHVAGQDGGGGANYVVVKSSNGNTLRTFRYCESGKATFVALQNAPTSLAHWREVHIEQSSGEGNTVAPSFFVGTAPSGTLSHKFRWFRQNSRVTFWFRYQASTAGSGNTGFNVEGLPDGTPLPLAFSTSLAGATWPGFTGTGLVASLPNGTLLDARAHLNDTDIPSGDPAGWVLIINFVSVSLRYAEAQVTYYTED